MRIGWKINEQWQFDLVGQNLLTDVHREFTDIADPFTPPVKIGRSAYGKLTWRF